MGSIATRFAWISARCASRSGSNLAGPCDSAALTADMAPWAMSPSSAISEPNPQSQSRAHTCEKIPNDFNYKKEKTGLGGRGAVEQNDHRERRLPLVAPASLQRRP
jgi:hypothetical protein